MDTGGTPHQLYGADERAKARWRAFPRRAASGNTVRGFSVWPDSLNGFLHSIADAGLELLRRGLRTQAPGQSPIQLCHDLLSTLGEASGTALARQIVEAYRRMTTEEKQAFFRALSAEFDVDPAAVIAAAENYKARRDARSLLALNAAAEPRRQELFRRINTAPEGSATIVAMRQDLLRLLADHPELAAVDADFQHLLSSWFNRGFLQLARIDWNAPAAVLEKLIQYESVHAIQGWGDLRRRLAGDRRCFAFFHPALPGDPVIFVEVALVKGVAGAIQPLIAHDAFEIDPKAADTAIFYSINNCHKGLRNVSFGNFLIKQVVLDIAKEFPNLRTFATLSPIPGFRDWMDSAKAGVLEDLLTAEQLARLAWLKDEDWHNDEARAEQLSEPLMRLCAHYLLRVKRDGFPIDPVARFHLRNGARLDRINWLGNRSPKGLRESAGMMVNYVYDPDAIVGNHEDYVNNRNVIASSSVRKLLRKAAR